jgi:hypothetical protein
MEKVKLSDYHENYCSQILIDEHSLGGGIRDEAEFNAIRYHCYKTLIFTKNFIEAFEGTDEEKSEFLQKVFDDLGKFTVSAPDAKKIEEIEMEEAKNVVKDMGIE